MKCFEKMKELELNNMAYVYRVSHFHPLLSSIPDTIFDDIYAAYKDFIACVYEYVKEDQDFLCKYLFTNATEIAHLNRNYTKVDRLQLHDGRERLDLKNLALAVYASHQSETFLQTAKTMNLNDSVLVNFKPLQLLGNLLQEKRTTEPELCEAYKNLMKGVIVDLIL